jgi:surface carbohydrate biosynthesis protein
MMKIRLFLPRRKKLLIYDGLSEKHLSNYLISSEYEVLDVRKESLNIPILTLSLMKYFFTKRSLSRIYCIEYIRFVNPSVVITLIDNNKNFWLYKEIFNHITFVFVQNGIRGVVGDVFDSLINQENRGGGDYFVDYMFVFGKNTQNLYKEHIGGRFVRIGSFINNMDHLILPCDRDITYVLQFKLKDKESSYRYKTHCGKKITWDDVYCYNEEILKFLSDYCVRNQLSLSVLGRSKIKEEQMQEVKYVNSIISESCYEYIPSKNQYTSYEELLRSKVIVVLESTLGYEMLSRRKRVVYLGVREKTLGESSRYGWPAMPERGFFWTNRYKRSEFERVIRNVVNATSEKWEDICSRYVNYFIEYDPGNIKFLSIMKKNNINLK